MADLWLLMGTAGLLGVAHTLLGPDHYLPFVALARAGGWSRRKTLSVTLGCGLGHVLSSLALGVLGIGLGLAVSRLKAIESARGMIAAWLLIGLGLTYAVWGIWRGFRRQPHSHLHVHAGTEPGQPIQHAHSHTHAGPHAHPHGDLNRTGPWILFTILVFGPCEPLIPLLLYPAVQASWSGVFWVTLTFGVATLATMAAAVLVVQAGARRMSFGWLERYPHVLFGSTLVLCGLAIRFLGL